MKIEVFVHRKWVRDLEIGIYMRNSINTNMKHLRKFFTNASVLQHIGCVYILNLENAWRYLFENVRTELAGLGGRANDFIS